MNHEILRLLKPVRKRWLRPLEKYRISIEYESATEITDRTIAVADAFGLGIDKARKFKVYDNFEVEIGPKDIVYITGDSGSGKSVLLKWLEKALKPNTINVADIKPEPDKPLVEQIGKSLEEGLELLSRAGLNDAFLFVRRYRELSDGQKYRFKIAKMMESGKQYWIFDEFCSLLDRDTAKIVAYNVQKLARKAGKAVLVATTHTDLFEDLAPSVHIHKRFGKEATVNYYPNAPAKECSLIREMRIEEGSTEDWRRLARFHYRSHRLPSPRKIFKLVRGDEICGVIVYSYPAPVAYGRRKVLPKMSMKELNKKLSVISRVVIHPKYRSIGLGAKLVRETLPLADTPHVELIDVMAKYNPFFEKAGMQKICQQPPAKQAQKIAETLAKLGFNIQLLGSKAYILNKLKTLKKQQINTIKRAFIKNPHPRILKQFETNLPYGKKENFKQKIKNTSLQKLADLIRICGQLIQTKVYLFWTKHSYRSITFQH